MNVTRTGIEWQKTVENEHAQSDRARKTVASADFWGPVAHPLAPMKPDVYLFSANAATMWRRWIFPVAVRGRESAM